MAFPTYPQLRGSRFQPLDSPTLFEAQYGEAVTFTTFSETPGVFLLRYQVTASELAALESNFVSNRAGPQSFTWQQDSTSHNVRWEAPPQSTYLAPDLYSVTVRLRKAT